MPERPVIAAAVVLTEGDMQTEEVEEQEIKWHHETFPTTFMTFEILQT